MAGQAIAPYIVTGAFTLGGVIVGKTWDLLSTSVTWKREQRATAYGGLVTALENAYVEMSSEDYDRDRVDAALVEVSRASGLVDMFGSVAVARCGHRVWNAMEIDLSHEDLEDMGEDEWAEASAHLRGLINDFRDAARRDLKQPVIGDLTADVDAADVRT